MTHTGPLASFPDVKARAGEPAPPKKLLGAVERAEGLDGTLVEFQQAL